MKCSRNLLIELISKCHAEREAPGRYSKAKTMEKVRFSRIINEHFEQSAERRVDSMKVLPAGFVPSCKACVHDIHVNKAQ
jgi:hypothetical protein